MYILQFNTHDDMMETPMQTFAVNATKLMSLNLSINHQKWSLKYVDMNS